MWIVWVFAILIIMLAHENKECAEFFENAPKILIIATSYNKKLRYELRSVIQPNGVIGTIDEIEHRINQIHNNPEEMLIITTGLFKKTKFNALKQRILYENNYDVYFVKFCVQKSILTTS